VEQGAAGRRRTAESRLQARNLQRCPPQTGVQTRMDILQSTCCRRFSKREDVMTPQVYEVTARRWIEAWNSRDLNRVLALYDDGAEMVSAGIIRLGLNAAGRVQGKAQLRAYWSRALENLPDLRFELLDVSMSPDSIVVRYRNERGQTICEYLRLNAAGRIIQGSANHAMG
jgi:hypothetical protein